MAALIISPLPKLSPTKAPESSESSSGAAEGSESGEPTMDEEALYEASKKSKIQRIQPQKKSKKTSLTPAKKKADKKNDSDQGFVRNNDSTISSGDTSSGSSTWEKRKGSQQRFLKQKLNCSEKTRTGTSFTMQANVGSYNNLKGTSLVERNVPGDSLMCT